MPTTASSFEHGSALRRWTIPRSSDSPTLGGYLRHAAAGTDPTLVDPGYRARIEEVAGAFPADRIHVFGFECHLGAGNGRADFAFKLLDAAALAACLEPAAAPGTEPRARLERLCQAWRDEPPLAAGIRDICFEYDIPADGPAAGPPSVFFTAGAGTPAVLARTVALLKGDAFLQSVRPALERSLACLPPHAGIPLWGMMLPRGAPAVRLCANRIAPGQVQPFLAAQDWRGDSRGLEEALGWAGPDVARILVDWDVGAGVHPRVGVEFHFATGLAPAAPYPWEPLLTRLTGRGLCPRQAAEALCRFPGLSAPVCAVPENLAAAAVLFGRREFVFARKLSHFKIVVDGSGELAAKAYLEFRLCWRPQTSCRAANEANMPPEAMSSR